MRSTIEGMDGLDIGSKYREFAVFCQADSEFHQGVILASGNRFLGEVHLCLRPHQHISRLWVGHASRDAASTMQEHDEILLALETRDPELAEVLMRRHLLHAGAANRLLLQQPDGAA
jgi:DNA-binding GntR family transcriptional regulator